MHSVDIHQVGLSDYGKPGNYFERQIGRWTKQYRAAETETIPEMEKLIDWLPGICQRMTVAFHWCMVTIDWTT